MTGPQLRLDARPKTCLRLGTVLGDDRFGRTGSCGEQLGRDRRIGSDDDPVALNIAACAHRSFDDRRPANLRLATEPVWLGTFLR